MCFNHFGKALRFCVFFTSMASICRFHVDLEAAVSYEVQISSPNIGSEQQEAIGTWSSEIRVQRRDIGRSVTCGSTKTQSSVIRGMCLCYRLRNRMITTESASMYAR